MTPLGHFTSLNKAIVKLARDGDLAAFQSFMIGRFRDELPKVDPSRVLPTLEAVNRAKAAIERRTRLPAKPKRIPRKGKKAPGIDWTGNPALRARLASLYAKFGDGPGAHKAVAAEMGISVGQARLAKRRHLDAAAQFQIAA
jgi:hypothetical protein